MATVGTGSPVFAGEQINFYLDGTASGSWDLSKEASRIFLILLIASTDQRSEDSLICIFRDTVKVESEIDVQGAAMWFGSISK
jgi:hypothetical protein